MNNKETVIEIYESFGKGDVDAILEHIDDNVEWDYGSTSIPVPWLMRRDGKEDVAGFFASTAALEFHEFRPKEILEADELVVALLDVDFTVKATGKRVHERDELHVFRFGPNGKVVKFRHGVDSFEHYRAWNQALAAA
ncbi:MAG TPA: nuclear transport factor 2 family protein [Pyrinomonadaceae bacterium]|mgnify:CR=1 FL=1|nr:nuclear transport factor 2 family protein [Pyrinomonadaceae bacterium]